LPIRIAGKLKEYNQQDLKSGWIFVAVRGVVGKLRAAARARKPGVVRMPDRK
jgi:microcompartment protein CcmL/EutN